MKTVMSQFLQDEQGQTATEYMLIVSVIVIAVVAAAYSFLPSFQKGVESLAQDVESILDTGKILGGSDGSAR